MLFLAFDSEFIYLFGALAAFAITFFFMSNFADKLPHDQGRLYAVDGELSKGKARGAGLLFIVALVLCDIVFNILTIERTIYLIVIAFSMISGYLDDASSKPWGEYLKGAIDLVLSAIVAVNYLYYNGNSFSIGANGGHTVTLPYWLFGVLIVALVWAAINVTNCTDGVDGLCGTLSIITLGSFYVIMREANGIGDYSYTIILTIAVVLAYLWFNATPSTILMGDAGSRALGVIIAIAALKSGCPLLYIPLSIVMLLDGGLGLLKVALLRFLKIHILKNTRCPLHDQARKVKNWSNTQVCYRFAIIQAIVSLAFVWLYGMI